jgi:hypothetical protein
MLCLAIHIYENGNLQPTPSIRVPLAALATIAKFIPHKVTGNLKERGIDIEQIVHDAATTSEPGVLMDLTDDDDRIVIAIETMQASKLQQLTSGARQ